MRKKIVGVTVGTPISPEALKKKMGIGEGSGGNIEEHNTDPTSHADIRKRLSAANIVESASGDVIAVSDASDMELAGLRIFGKTTQNGTPTPDTPVPLESVGESVNVTVCGKNLLNMPERILNWVGVKATAKGSEVIFSGTSTSNWGDSFLVANSVWFPNGTYTLGVKNLEKISEVQVNVYDESGMEVGLSRRRLLADYPSVTFTTDTTFTMKLTFVLPVNTAYGDESNPTTLYIQLESGTAATEYEPYKGQVLTISTPNCLPGIPVTSGGNYTDENGQQWICDEVDFEKGKYVQRVYSHVLDGSVQPTLNTGSKVDTNGGKRFALKLPKLPACIDQTSIANALCSHIAQIMSQGSSYHHTGSESVYSIGDADGYVSFRMKGINTVEAMTSFLTQSPMTVLYELATPIYHDLSAEELAAYTVLHTNYPNTTIFNDEGAGMEVKYVADTKLYIDKKFAELSTALLNQ